MREEYQFTVIYDPVDPYFLINYGSRRTMAKYYLAKNGYTQGFFPEILPYKLGKEEKLRAKLFPQKNGEVQFEPGFRSANIIQLVNALEEIGDFNSFKNNFFVAILGKRRYHRDNSWAMPVIFVNKDKRNKSNGLGLVNGILSLGDAKSQRFVSDCQLCFLGVKEISEDKAGKEEALFIKIKNKYFYFSEHSEFLVTEHNLAIIEPDFRENEIKTRRKFDYKNLVLSDFINKYINESSSSFKAQILEDGAGQKKLIINFS